METAYLYTTEEALRHFQVTESEGLSDQMVSEALKKYGRNGDFPAATSPQRLD